MASIEAEITRLFFLTTGFIRSEVGHRERGDVERRHRFPDRRPPVGSRRLSAGPAGRARPDVDGAAAARDDADVCRSLQVQIPLTLSNQQGKDWSSVCGQIFQVCFIICYYDHGLVITHTHSRGVGCRSGDIIFKFAVFLDRSMH